MRLSIRVPRSAWKAYLIVGLTLAFSFLVLPDGSPIEGVLYPLLTLTTAIATVVAAAAYRPPLRGMWYVFSIGVVLTATANAYYSWVAVIRHEPLPFPSAADGLWLGAYCFYIMMFSTVIQRRTNERTSILDALTVTTGIGLVSWIYLISPVVGNAELPVLSRAVLSAYPAVDVLLIAVLVSLAFTSGTRTPSFWLFIATISTQLVGDLLLGAMQLSGTFTFGGPVFMFWQTAVVCLGAALLHPSMAGLTTPPAAGERPPGMRLRLPLLAFSALLPAAVLLLDPAQGRGGSLQIIAVVAATLFIMVLVRVGGLARQVRRYSNELDVRLRQLQESVERERAATAAREALEAELRHAQKLEAVGRLAAGVAHEINTPLQTIGSSLVFTNEAMRGMLQLLEEYRRRHGNDNIMRELEGDLDFEFIAEELPLTLESMSDNADRISSIVKAMKIFGRPDNAGAELADVNEALIATEIITRSSFMPSADVQFELDESLPSIHCHPDDLNHVWLNLLTNAVHAVEATGTRGRVLIKSEYLEDEQRAVFQFIDNGCGIPASALDKVYDPFFTTKEVGAGTGQGLTVARSIVVERHGGTIDIESEEGNGTTVTVSLPAARVLQKAPQPVS